MRRAFGNEREVHDALHGVAAPTQERGRDVDGGAMHRAERADEDAMDGLGVQPVVRDVGPRHIVVEQEAHIIEAQGAGLGTSGGSAP